MNSLVESMEAISKRRLALGGAQFGLDYGVSNRDGRTSDREARAILETARAAGVTLIDTAPAYGDSEERLGRLASPKQFHFVSKTPVLGKPLLGPTELSAVEQSVQRSCERLGGKLAAILVHHAGDLLARGGEALFVTLRRLQERKLVDKIGVSVYEARELDALVSRYDLGVVQLPLNVLDQRLVNSGHLRRLRQRGIEIHVRSAFLQGALLMDPAALPPALKLAAATIRRFHEACGGDVLTACLAYLGAQPEIDRVILGVNSDEQWRGILRAAGAPAPRIDYREFAIGDENIVNPSKWKRNEAA